MAIEDAAALGIAFSTKFFKGNIEEALAVYQDVRLPRVTRVQSAAAKAAYNINERIGRNFASLMEARALTRQDSRKIPTSPLTRSRTSETSLRLRK